MVELYLQRTAEVLGGNPILVPLYPPQISHGQAHREHSVLHYKDASVIAVYGSSLHGENCMEHMCTNCGQNGKFLNVAAGNKCTHH